MGDGRRLDIDTLRRVLDERLGASVDAPSALGGATGIAFHSARVQPGDAFFALPGASGHGIAHADDALARGAAFVISDRPHPRGARVPDPGAALLALGAEARDRRTAPLVGVTGSAGKTTCKDFVAAALGARRSPGNLNTTLALAEAMVEAWLEDGGGEPMVLELGIDHVGEAGGLADLVRPTHTVLTLVAAAHLDGLRDLATVAREKARILAAGSERRYAAAATEAFLPEGLRSGTTVYGLGRDRAPTGRYLATPDGGVLEAELGGPGGRVRVALPGLGRAVAEHALVALLVARDLGVDPEVAAGRIAAAAIEPRRLQPHRLGALLLVDDSYNANPASMALALETLEGLPGPRAAVLGDMLELAGEAPERHRELGERTRGLDLVWAVGAHAAEVAAGNPAVRTFPDVAAARRAAGALPRSGTLLVKGSRGVALDGLVDALLAEGRERPAVAGPNDPVRSTR